MANLNKEAERVQKKKEYNDEPVYYCKRCLSLKIMDIKDLIFCDDCTGTDIGTATIDEWKKMYKERYKRDFIPEKKKK